MLSLRYPFCQINSGFQSRMFPLLENTIWYCFLEVKNLLAFIVLQVAQKFNDSIDGKKPDKFKVIVSSHNFHNTPSVEAIADLVTRIQVGSYLTHGALEAGAVSAPGKPLFSQQIQTRVQTRAHHFAACLRHYCLVFDAIYPPKDASTKGNTAMMQAYKHIKWHWIIAVKHNHISRSARELTNLKPKTH